MTVEAFSISSNGGSPCTTCSASISDTTVDLDDETGEGSVCLALQLRHKLLFGAAGFYGLRDTATNVEVSVHYCYRFNYR